MIPILFGPDETQFNTNGICRLVDCLSCTVEEERNGIFECKFEYPVTGRHYKDIQEGCIILATHDDTRVPQPFDVYARKTPVNGIVTFYARHISYRLGNVLLRPFTASSCAEAFVKIKQYSANDNPFTFWTDKQVDAAFTVDRPVSVKEILGGVQGSILDVYGKAEYEWDKWDVKLHLNRGQVKPVQIRYGKNLSDLVYEKDISKQYNAVAPYWVSEDGSEVFTLPEYIVGAESSEQFEIVDYADNNIIDDDNEIIVYGEPTVKPVPLDLSSSYQNKPTEEQLRQKALNSLSGHWEPDENIEIDFVHLWQTEEYKDVAVLQRCSLCDKVNVYFTELGVVAERQQIVRVVYNTLLDRYDLMELGQARTSFAKVLQGNIEESIKKQLPSKSYLEYAVDHATEMITGGLGGNVIIGRNADGVPNEILIMDTIDRDTAVNVWRFNAGGLGHSHSGYNGPFNDVALTADGKINANMITTGTLTANIIRAGILADLEELNSLNLETGAFHFGDDTNYLTYDPTTGNLDINVSSFSLSGSSIADIASGVVTTYDATLNQVEIFNRLTNNQANQGIYLQTDDGVTNLYINASMINAGYISADRIEAGSIGSGKLDVSELSAISSELGAITGGSLNIGNGAFVVTSAGALTATSGSFLGTIQAGTYLGLPNTGMSVTSNGGLSGSGLAAYTGPVLGGSTIGTLPVVATGLSYEYDGSIMSFTTSGLSMGSGIALGVDGTGKISDIKIGKTSIYSEGHTAYSSPVNGFYLGSDGSFGVGNNAGNYLHFDATNGRLDIKVTSFALTGGQTIDSIAQSKADSALNSAKTYADGKASAAQSNAETYAYTQATNAYNNAKSYTDGQISSLPTPEAMTQQNVFNALTNNGQTQGIYLHTDSDGVSRVYINASYIASGTIAANLISASNLSAISSNLGTVTAGSINISGTGTGAGTMTLSNGVLSAMNAVIDGTITGHNAGFDGTFTVGNIGQTNDAVFNCGIDCGNISAGNVSGTTFSCSTLNATNISGTHFTSPWTIQGMGTVSTNTAMFNISGSVGTIAYGSASSIRYKDVIRNMTDEDIEKAYAIQPVIAKYKDGYLMEDDERVGMAYPMFVAEDVEKYLPTVATHRDGLTENWDERAMIPVMFQMIKELKAELEVLKNGETNKRP